MVGPECNSAKHYSALIALLFAANTVSNSFPPLLSHHINLPPIFQSTSSLGIPTLALIHLHPAVMPLVVVSLPTEPTLLPTLKLPASRRPFSLPRKADSHQTLRSALDNLQPQSHSNTTQHNRGTAKSINRRKRSLLSMTILSLHHFQ